MPVSMKSSYESTATWEACQIFSEDTGARLAGASVTTTATLLCVSRAPVSKVTTAYTDHGKTYQLRGTVAENQN